MTYYSLGDSLYRAGLFETYCFIIDSKVSYIYFFRKTDGIYDLTMENL